jgi:hypothetical protein
MELVVRAFPVLPGQVEHMQDFVEKLRTDRAAEAADFYRRMGVTRESWHMQDTPTGTWVIAVTWVLNKPLEVAAETYAASEDAFDRWFKQQVMQVTGVNPDTTPLGPATQCIFDSWATAG